MKIDLSGKPMMSDADIAAIENILEKRKPKMCLEWGAGNSTIYFPNKFPEIKVWMAIEHNCHYIEYLTPLVNRDVVELLCVPYTEGEFYNETYVDLVKSQKDKWDFILIDGISEKREECLRVAMEIVKPDGIVLLHDADRKEYHGFVNKYDRRKRLTEGEIPTGNGFVTHRGLTAFHR